MKKIIEITSNGVKLHTIDGANSSIHPTVYELRKSIYYSTTLRKHRNIDTEYIVSSFDNNGVKSMTPTNSLYDVFKSVREIARTYKPVLENHNDVKVCILKSSSPKEDDNINYIGYLIDISDLIDIFSKENINIEININNITVPMTVNFLGSIGISVKVNGELSEEISDITFGGNKQYLENIFNEIFN